MSERTPLKIGDRVRTVSCHQVNPREWTPEGLAKKRFYVDGTIIGEHNSHGLCYDVRHTDGTIACYDPWELERLDKMVVSLVELMQTKNIEFEKHTLSGKPRLTGHRISVGQLLAELLEISGIQIKDVADNYDLDIDSLKAMFNDVAHFYDQHWDRDDTPFVRVTAPERR